MTVPVHRHSDLRVCGHTTVVSGQSSVYANGLLISVDNDPNTGGGGNLSATAKKVYCEGILVVNHTPDPASPDGSCPIAPHCAPVTDQGSPDVFVADG